MAEGVLVATVPSKKELPHSRSIILASYKQKLEKQEIHRILKIQNFKIFKIFKNPKFQKIEIFKIACTGLDTQFSSNEKTKILITLFSRHVQDQ